MNAEKFLPLIVSGAFGSFLLTFLYAVLRWARADSMARGKHGWPLPVLLAAGPILSLAARLIFPAFIPRSIFISMFFVIPFAAWIGWLLLRPAIQQKSEDPVICGRETSASRWILVLSLVASGYGMGIAWLVQFVDYPMYLAVPPDAFLTYYGQYLQAIVFPVIVALSLSWCLSALLILNRPRAIPAWAPWAAVGLALLGFIASQILEAPYNLDLVAHGFKAEAIRAKIANNWFRLIPWTLQAALLSWMTHLALRVAEQKNGLSETR